MISPEFARRIEPALIVLIAVHSYAIGIMLLFVTDWGLAFGGWTHVEPLFFARQAGTFHFVVATGYLLEFFRHRGIGLLLTAKCSAVVVLTTMSLLTEQPWSVPVSAVGDAAMAAVVLAVHLRARQAVP